MFLCLMIGGCMGLALPKQKETKRQGLRHPLLGELSGQLFVKKGCRTIRCLAVDVSNSGLRVLTGEKIPPRTLMFLKFENRRIPLTVVWCQKDGSRSGSYACGLKTTKPTDDLVELFTTKGWLDSAEDIEFWLENVEFMNFSEEGFTEGINGISSVTRTSNFWTKSSASVYAGAAFYERQGSVPALQDSNDEKHKTMQSSWKEVVFLILRQKGKLSLDCGTS